jgi:hypothetical protein
MWTITEIPECVPARLTQVSLSPALESVTTQMVEHVLTNMVPWGKLSLLCTVPLPHSLYINELANILQPFSLNLHVHLFHHWFWWVTLPNPSIAQITLSPVKAPSSRRWDWFISQFIEWDSPIILCFQKVFILYWNKLPCFLRLFYILILLFHKFFEPNRCFIMQMNSDICEGFIGPSYSWTFRCYCKHLFKKLQSDTTHKNLGQLQSNCSYIGCSPSPTASTFHRECNKRR